MKLATIDSGLKTYWKTHPQDEVQYNKLQKRVEKIRHIRRLSGEAFSLREIISYVDSQD